MEEEKGVKQDMEEEGETFLMVEVEEEEKTTIKEEQLEEAIWPCLLPGEYWLDGRLSVQVGKCGAAY